MPRILLPLLFQQFQNLLYIVINFALRYQTTMNISIILNSMEKQSFEELAKQTLQGRFDPKNLSVADLDLMVLSVSSFGLSQVETDDLNRILDQAVIAQQQDLKAQCERVNRSIKAKIAEMRRQTERQQAKQEFRRWNVAKARAQIQADRQAEKHAPGWFTWIKNGFVGLIWKSDSEPSQPYEILPDSEDYLFATAAEKRRAIAKQSNKQIATQNRIPLEKYKRRQQNKKKQ